MMNKSIGSALLALTLVAAIPAHAESDEELKQQLEAQKQINELLKQRIHTLEAQHHSERGTQPDRPPRNLLRSRHENRGGPGTLPVSLEHLDETIVPRVEQQVKRIATIGPLSTVTPL